MSGGEDVEDIVTILAAHEADRAPISGAWACHCGVISTNGHIRTGNLTTREQRQDEYRRHVAQALAGLGLGGGLA
jgi:hypothetical protein